ncbi:hypothetical protein QJQ45_011755 [Haematococcus lacustris]|nr:hypothetical protein QJQ45_011755 [Haematococcus lacustris]
MKWESRQTKAGAKAVREGFRKVVEQPSMPSTIDRPDRLVIVDEFRLGQLQVGHAAWQALCAAAAAAWQQHCVAAAAGSFCDEPPPPQPKPSPPLLHQAQCHDNVRVCDVRIENVMGGLRRQVGLS